jgi:plasmid stabilization system protein ParE
LSGARTRYRVIIAPDAEADLRSASSYIRRDSLRASRAWLKGLRQRIRTLTQYPERCNLAPESASFDEPIRELFYGSRNRGTYRILFVVLDRTVFVLHIRHGAMLPLKPSAL